MITGYLISGAIEALVLVAVAYVLSRFTKDVVGRSLLAAFLLVAAAVYIVFAVRAGEGAYWVAGEAVGVGIYGTMALRGLRFSPLWLAAGWAFHPVWDVALHYFGPGGSFAPASYTIPCLTFDLTVAAYVAVAYGLGSLAAREPALREGVR
jgi:hypothetical protein